MWLTLGHGRGEDRGLAVARVARRRPARLDLDAAADHRLGRLLPLPGPTMLMLAHSRGGQGVRYATDDRCGNNNAGTLRGPRVMQGCKPDARA